MKGHYVKKAPPFSLTLAATVRAALEIEAKDKPCSLTDLCQLILERHVLAAGYLDDADANALRVMRELVSAAVEAAQRIRDDEGLIPDITDRAIRDCIADRDWLAKYAAFVQDDPFKSGVPGKRDINQNIGYWIKRSLGAKTIIDNKGKPANVKVLASIIQSYTPLKPA
jgi:hypothetical protein